MSAGRSEGARSDSIGVRSGSTLNRNTLPRVVLGVFLVIVLVIALVVRPWEIGPGSTPNPNPTQFGGLPTAFS